MDPPVIVALDEFIAPVRFISASPTNFVAYNVPLEGLYFKAFPLSFTSVVFVLLINGKL